MSTSQLDAAIQSAQAAATKNTDTEDSAIIVLNSIPAMIKAAVDAALAAGATPAQLQAINDVAAKLTAKSADLAAAIAANTTPPGPGPLAGKKP